jgi:glycosyltransferase involved in cell wall biosynthesis
MDFMKVVIVLEHRFEQTPDRAVWTQTQYARPFWESYLRVFDSVRVAARVRSVAEPTPGWQRADGGQVSFAPIPYFIGPWQYLLHRGQVRRAIRDAVEPNDAVILRVSSALANNLEPKLRREGRPYAVEVVADPYDVFSPGACRHPLAPFFRWYFPRRLRGQCRRAVRAAYVTRDALQRRYPCPAGEVGFSDVEITDAALVTEPRRARPDQARFTALFVGTLAQLYKAPDFLIDAVAKCRQGGVDLDLVLVGDGQYRPMLEEQSRRLGIAEHVRFRGQLSVGSAVRDEFDRADLFVLPSHQEGLPRAMVEAMARGLPCIGSTVGGIPELLAAEDMVPPGDAAALAERFTTVLRDPARRDRMSARNLETARTYHAERIAARRLAFYRTVREETESWLARRTAPVLCSPRSDACPGS